MIRISYNLEGKPQLVNFLLRGSYLELPFNPTTKTINWRQQDQELKTAFEQWVGSGGVLDLSDRAPSPQTPALDWKQFRKGMMPNAGFRRMTRDSADKESVVDLKIAAGIGTEEWTQLKSLWDACVDGLVIKPTAAEITSWNAVVNGARIGTAPAPFIFGSDGKLVLQ